jgi:hypothetical protein
LQERSLKILNLARYSVSNDDKKMTEQQYSGREDFNYNNSFHKTPFLHVGAGGSLRVYFTQQITGPNPEPTMYRA